MQQVLEAPAMQHAERETESSGFATEPHTVLSRFAKTMLRHMSTYAATTEQHREAPVDYICRTNPFLLAFSG